MDPSSHCIVFRSFRELAAVDGGVFCPRRRLCVILARSIFTQSGSLSGVPPADLVKQLSSLSRRHDHYSACWECTLPNQPVSIEEPKLGSYIYSRPFGLGFCCRCCLYHCCCFPSSRGEELLLVPLLCCDCAAAGAARLLIKAALCEWRKRKRSDWLVFFPEGAELVARQERGDWLGGAGAE